MSDTDNSRPPPPTPATVRPLAQCKTLAEVFQTQEFERRIAQALPSHMKVGTILRSFVQATSRNPDLLKCDLRQSISGFLTLAELGLPLTPALGMAHMIPFKGRILNRATNKWQDGYNLQIIIGYQGFIELAMRSGLIGGIHAEVVWPGDQFEFRLGTQQFLNHTPRGDHSATAKPTHAWAIAHFRGGDTMPPFEVYPYSKVLGIRDRSQGYLKALHAKQAATAEGKPIPRTWTDAPWVRDEEAMARKTMIRALAKYLPKSAELQGAAAIDDPERGYVDFSPILDAQPGDVQAVDLPIEEEPADPGSAYSVRQQPAPEPQRPAAQEAPRQAAPAPAPKAGPKAAAPAQAQRAAPPPPAEEEPPPADPSDYGLGSLPQSFPDTPAAQAALPQQEESAASFEYYVLDAQGEACSDLIAEPIAWAQAFRDHWDRASADGRAAMIEHNMDALSEAMPVAPNILHGVTKQQAAPEAAPAPPAFVAPQPVPVPMSRSGQPDFVAYLKAVRDVLPALGMTIPADEWVEQQISNLAECPVTQRLNLIGDITKRLGELGKRPSAALAALVQQQPPKAAAAPAPGLFEGSGADPDRAWVDARKAEISRCTTKDEVIVITKAPVHTQFLVGLDARNPSLAAEFRSHAVAHVQKLAAQAADQGQQP